MKPFAKRFLALSSAAAITLTTIPAVYAAREAQQEASAPIGAIMTADWSDLENTGIAKKARFAAANAPVTRQDLSGMVMSCYKSVTGLSDQDLGDPMQVFLDTDDLDTRHAAELGMVTSMGAGFFAPEQVVTRQEFFTAAVAMQRHRFFSAGHQSAYHRQSQQQRYDTFHVVSSLKNINLLCIISKLYLI